jgi:hypothetical protein
MNCIYHYKKQNLLLGILTGLILFTSCNLDEKFYSEVTPCSGRAFMGYTSLKHPLSLV